MRTHFLKVLSSVLILSITAACSIPTAPGSPTPEPPTATPTPVPLPSLAITLGATNDPQGITLDQGGDVDTQAVTAGDPAQEARESGNGAALGSPDGNTVPDSYIQFNVDDKQLSGGKPTSHVRVEVDYLDKGSDAFSLEYDALPAAGSDGKFAGGGVVAKTGTDTFKTAIFNLCDANFANRDNGADFRLSDNGDGADTIRAVRVVGLPPAGAQTFNVDDFGANPFDDKPDSDAIQALLDSTCSGDMVVFTSGVNAPGYTGYLIDKTLFLTGTTAKHDLTFTSSDPGDHALLRATADLKGYVVRLYARSRFWDAGGVDNIDFGNIDVSGGRDVRVCSGPDGREDGRADNWGSWLPECSQAGDPWCNAGGIGMDGSLDWDDPAQNYTGQPSRWTTGVNVHDVVDSQVECGSAFAFFSAAGTVRNVTIDTAGDHVHETGCARTDDDGDLTGWSDGMTLAGPGHVIKGNTVINPSDVGIVFFGGRDTVISDNVVKVTSGNYGAFAGIAVHPWIFGNISGVQVTGNQVTSEGDSQCGGVHAGINLGPQMWSAGCVDGNNWTTAFGNKGACSQRPSQQKIVACASRGFCQIWAYLPEGATFTLKDNVVTGAHINYLVDGFAILGRFIDENNVSQSPRLSDWHAARAGCFGVRWGALDKVAHDPSLPGYTDLVIHCER